MTAIPDWLLKLPADGYINAKELRTLIPQFSATTTLKVLLKYGHIPQPNGRTGIWGCNKSCQWKVKDIRRWLRGKPD